MDSVYWVYRNPYIVFDELFRSSWASLLARILPIRVFTWSQTKHMYVLDTNVYSKQNSRVVKRTLSYVWHATSKASDQIARMRSQIRDFAFRSCSTFGPIHIMESEHLTERTGTPGVQNLRRGHRCVYGLLHIPVLIRELIIRFIFYSYGWYDRHLICLDRRKWCSRRYLWISRSQIDSRNDWLNT